MVVKFYVGDTMNEGLRVNETLTMKHTDSISKTVRFERIKGPMGNYITWKDLARLDRGNRFMVDLDSEHGIVRDTKTGQWPSLRQVVETLVGYSKPPLMGFVQDALKDAEGAGPDSKRDDMEAENEEG